MDREKLNGNDTAATNGAPNTPDAGTVEQINLSDFMITGRELLSRRGSEKSRREDEVRQDLVHQRLFFYSIETFSRNKSGPIAEFSYLVADEGLNEIEGRSGRFLMRRRGPGSGKTSSRRKSSRCSRGGTSSGSAGTM